MGRFHRIARLIVFGALVAGCYTLQPAMGVTPQLGSDIALDLTDAGRAAMGGQMGPAITQIEGRLVQVSSDEFVVGVRSVKLIGGGENTWAGEQVRVKREYVSTFYRRNFSAAKTALFTVVVVAVVVATAISLKQVVGSGTGEPGNPKVDSTGATVRRPAGPLLIPHRAP